MNKASHTFLAAGVLLAIVWGALAFGAVYPWAYVPLAALCAVVGLLSLAAAPARTPVAAVAFGLTLIAGATALQLAPLSPRTLSRLSPAADAYLTQYDFSYRVIQSAGLAEDLPASNPPPAKHALSLAPERTLVGLALFTAFALLMLGGAQLLSVTGVAPMAHRIVIFGVALALIGIVQYAFLGHSEREPIKVYGFWTPKYRAMSFGPFINRNHFAGWILMGMPLALAGACAAAQSTPGGVPGSRHGLMRWLSGPEAARTSLMAFAAGIMGLSLLLSESRSGMAGLAAGSLVFAALIVSRQSSRRTKLLTVAAFVVAAGLVAGWAGLDVLARRATSVGRDASTIGGRRVAWASAVDVIRDFPLTGTGLNTFSAAMVHYQEARPDNLHFQEAHNEYLQLAAEGGVLVGVPVVLTLLLFVRQVRRRFREAPHSGTTYWFRVGAVIGLVTIAFQSLVEFSLQMPGNAALCAVLGAIALHRSPRLRRTPRAAGPDEPAQPDQLSGT